MAPSPNDPVRIVSIAQTVLTQIAASVLAAFDVPVQNSALNAHWGDVIGNKTDTVAGNSLVSLLRTLIANIQLPTVTQTTGTFVYDETSALEQTLSTITITARSKVGAIWLDMVNVTQDTTIRVYHQIDGVNYRQFQSNAWVTADDDGVLVDGFAAYRNIRIMLQCAGGGAGNVNIIYAVV